MDPTKKLDPKSFTGRILGESLARLTAAAKEKGDSEAEAKVKELGEKCFGDYGMPVMYEAWKPLGGATSFEDAEAYTEGVEYEAKVNDLTWRFRDIITNVLAADTIEIGAKGAAIAAAAGDFEARLSAFRAREAAEGPADEADEADMVAAILAAGQREFTSALSDVKAGKRIKGTTLKTLTDAKDALIDVINWGSYAENDPAENIEEKVDLSEINSTGSSFEGGENPADPGQDPNKANKGLKQLVGGLREMLAKRHATPAATTPAKTHFVDANKKDFQNGFVAFKDAEGTYRWFSVYSNKFYDREKEVFPEAAHKEFVEYVDRTKEYPELWSWHQPIVMGKADLVDYDAANGLAVAAGYFYPGFQDAAERLASMKDLGVSHGYNYPSEDKGTGTYSLYRTFEVSPLPARKAANPVTSFVAEIQEGGMLTKEKRDWLVELHGEESVKRLESGLSVMGKELAGSGIGFKEISEALVGAKADKPDPGEKCPTCGMTMPGGSKEASAATGAPGSVPLVNQAAGALDASTIAAAIAAGVKEAIAPLEAEIVRLKATDDERIASQYGPRFDPSRRGPSESDGTLVSGSREAQAAVKEMGDDLSAQVRAAMKDMKVAEKGAGRADLPDEMQYYGRMGILGAPPVAEPV